MSFFLALLLVLLGVGLDRAWLWLRAVDQAYRSGLFTIEDARNEAMSDIAERRRRAEELMRRAAFRRRPR